MISSTLRMISSLLILTSLGITVFTLYFMAHDLSSMGISLTVKNLEVSDGNLYFNLMFNFTYTGSYHIQNFQVKMIIDDKQFSSSSIVLQRGLNIISIPSSLNLNSIGKNVTVTMSLSGVYARVMPVSVTVPSKEYLRIDVFSYPEVMISDYNSTHAVVSSRTVSIAKVNVDVIFVLMAYDREVDRVVSSPPIKAGDAILLTWYVRYEDLDKLSSIDLYLSSPRGLIKIYSWRLRR